jgi:hypothetical protein
MLVTNRRYKLFTPELTTERRYPIYGSVMQCHISRVILTTDSLFSTFSQLCFCLFWDQLFMFSSSSLVFFCSYYVSPSLLSEFSAPHYRPRTNPPSICSSWPIIHVISNYLWARLIPSTGWVWQSSSITLYRSQSTSVQISLSQSYHRICKFEKIMSKIKLTYR